MLKKKVLGKAVVSAVLIAAIPVSVFAQDINIAVNGSYVSFANQPPIVVEGRTLIPLRSVFEELGYTIDWEADTKTAILENGRNTIKIQAGSDILSVNYTEKPIDVPAQVINGTMMIPLRAISENMGFSVNWDANTKTAVISDRLDETNSVETFSDEDIAFFENLQSEFDAFNKKYESTEYQKANNDFTEALETRTMPNADTLAKMKEMTCELRPLLQKTADNMSEAAVPEKYKELYKMFNVTVNESIPFLDKITDFCEGKISIDELSDYYEQLSDLLDTLLSNSKENLLLNF